ncbi:xylulokinase [Candidatus Bathyarchaeota archaeon]|nr:xylulokinase [Candidatus Bathyarchaeota archaeon]
MARKEYVAAIDAGTIGCRTIIFDTEGHEIGRAYDEYLSYYPLPAWVEQNAEDWWITACNTVKRAIATTKVNPEDIVGVSVTNQRETIVPVDIDGKPLRNAIVWQDRRTVPQCEWIKKNVGADVVYQITGLTVDPYFSAPKILWIMENQPEIVKKTFKFLLVHDYIEYKLTGEFVTDWSNASRTMLFDVEKFEWSEKLSNEMGIPKEKMPTAYASGTKVGEVTKEAAESTGFAEGTPVAAGGGDQQCGAVGVGVVRLGRIKATTGTGTFMLAFLDEPKRDRQKRVLCSCHAVPGKWVMEASMFTTGAVYRWFRDRFGQLEKLTASQLGIDAYELLNDEADAAPVGSGGVLVIPHFIGAGAPHWDPKARGVILGLALGHERKHVIRAIMEGVCFEIRRNIEVMRELGIKIEEMRITGGATRNPTWNQIQADVYGIPVAKGVVEEATSLGAAILAGVGAGIYRDVADAAEKMVIIGERRMPIAKNHDLYNKLYEVHKAVYQALKQANVYARLAEFTV